MKLWTQQGIGHSLCSGHVDWERSRYLKHDIPRIKEGYAKLKLLVGTDQIIWCTNKPEKYFPSYVWTWELDVPEGRILQIVDGDIWELLIGAKSVPDRIEMQICKELEQLDFRNNEERIQADLERRMAYWDQPAPHGGWETKLFLADPTASSANILLQHPLDRSWVQKVTDHKGNEIALASI